MGKKSRKNRYHKASRSNRTGRNDLDPRWFVAGFGIFLSIAIVVLIILTGGDSSAGKTKSSASLVANSAFYDFGEIDIFGGKVSTEYTVTNTGSEPLTLTSARTSCMCTEGFIDDQQFGMHKDLSQKITLQPGASKQVKAVYDPMAHGPDATGPIDREVILRTDSASTKEVKLRFRGNVVKK